MLRRTGCFSGRKPDILCNSSRMAFAIMDFPDQLSPIGQWMRQRSMLTSLNANARLAPAGSEAVKPEMVSSPLTCTPGC
jgi:hypothetical protein